MKCWWFFIFWALGSGLYAQEPEGTAVTRDWKEVDRLISKDQFKAAHTLATELREAAQQAEDAEEWTRGLIKEVQLSTGLHGYEKAVRTLREQPWPEAPRHRLILELFYARSLVQYTQTYSWEIEQREKVKSSDEVDLKAWTKDQILAEAHRAYLRLWKEREGWQGESLGSFAEHIHQNNYPARIRGTLRDTVTYLWVELLADTTFWRPEQSSETWRLDVSELLSNDLSLDLENPGHPLHAIAFLLGDLETWHRQNDRPEAAFEARLERLRRLRGSLDQEKDRAAIEADLAEHLDVLGQSFEWWAMGQAILAEFARDRGDLVQALEIARAGYEIHPKSAGGQRCNHLIHAIESPGYSLESMALDGPDRRSIRVKHKNLERLFFRAYRLDLLRSLISSLDYNLLPDRRQIPQLLAVREPLFEWAVDLPATPDYELHDTYITPPFKKPGLYVVVASARKDFAETSNSRAALNLMISDLVIQAEVREGVQEITVRSGDTGKSLSEVRVDLYRANWRKGHEQIDSRYTEAQGGVQFEKLSHRQRHFVIARKGHDVSFLMLQNWYPGRDSEKPHSSLVYTDRSVYRPGQKIHFKVVAYGEESQAGQFRTLAKTPVQVRLLDANGEEVEQQDLSTNDFGSASGTFTIPSGRLLGPWQVATSLQGRAQIRVEEYKRPTFEVEVKAPEAPLRLNQPARLQGEARYFFGLPVSSGEMAWRITRDPVIPGDWWWFPPTLRGRQTVASGVGEVEPDGSFEVKFTPEADERLAKNPRLSYYYTLYVDVRDEGGETRSAERSYRLGFVSVEATVESPAGFFLEQQAVGLTVQRKDLNGSPRAGQGTFQVFALEQPAETYLPAEQPLEIPVESGLDSVRTPGDDLRPRWRPDYRPQQILTQWDSGKSVQSGSLEHGENGLAEVRVDPLPAGAYRLTYSTTDDFGADLVIHHEFLVVREEKTPLALPLLLELEKSTVSVGDTARLLIHTGLGDQDLALTIETSEGIQQKILEAGEPTRLLEIPIGPELRGGFDVRLVGLRDHQWMAFHERVLVPWDDRRLKVEFATFRDHLRPGARETWRVTVRGAEGEPPAQDVAEVLAYMYDKSLDLFASHDPPNPLSLYPTFRRQTYDSHNLAMTREIWRRNEGFHRRVVFPSFHGDRLEFYDNYALGGPGRRHGRGAPRAMAMRAMPVEKARAVPQAAAAEMAMDTTMEAESLEEAPPPPGRSESDPSSPTPGAEPVRSNFAETAFFFPHLRLDEDGAVSFEFEVPEAVTEWAVWAHALTRDFRTGQDQRQTRTVKELLVRPYLPRFFREGDRAELRVVVNNAGDAPLEGTLNFEILDAQSLDTDQEKSLLAAFGLGDSTARGVPFSVEPGEGTRLVFPVTAPFEVGPVAIRAVARAGDLSDGELRPVPVLPSRLHLSQSRFATLHDQDERSLRFEDLIRDDDPSRENERLVVTVDGQLFYGVLNALPYLVEYPYQCTEQTLNRFLSTGIVSSLFDRYPSVARMAEKLSQRETPLEPWDEPDPNHTMLLEESPWLARARGGSTPEGAELLKVLDPAVARAVRDKALADLANAQTALGGFPWWPGGPPSPHMTLYLMMGFSRALEFGVDVPREMVLRGWEYLHQHYVDHWARRMTEKECCPEWITFLQYVLSNYPDPEWSGHLFSDDDRRRMLDFSFRHWREHSPLLKGYLALVLTRSGKLDEARMVWESVMDSSTTTQDEGTFWAPEDRAWLWYNDTIETHAFALRTLSELDPEDSRRTGLVQWLFLNKKLNHWKSTRATAEVIYSLAHYLAQEETLEQREEVTVELGSLEHEFVFEPDEYTGAKNQVVLEGSEITPSHGEIQVHKETPGFLFASATWHFATDKLPDQAEGDFFKVERTYFRRTHDGKDWTLEPLSDGASLEVGDQLEVQLSISARHAAEYVHLRDPRGAGFEPETLTSGYKWDLGLGFFEEIRDSATNFFFDALPVGEYTLKYRLRAQVAGTFRVGPATLQSMYAPEFVAYSTGREIEIIEDSAEESSP